MTRTRMVAAASVFLGGLVLVAALKLSGGGAARASVPSVLAKRGDIVLSVGGLGKIVDAQAAARSVLPASPGGSSFGSASAASAAPSGAAVTNQSRAVFPAGPGRVAKIFVVPGEHVSAGRPLVQLDDANARSAAAVAQATLDQATAQLQGDRTGVTAQSLAAAKASLATAQATLLTAQQGLVDTLRVNRDTLVAARQQMAQARAQLGLDSTVLGPNPPALVAAEAQLAAAQVQRTADRKSAGPNPQAAASARAAIFAGQTNLAAAQAALANTQAVNTQQASTAQHNLDSARSELSLDQAKLERDRTTERNLCGSTSPTITSLTSSDCITAVASADADEQAVARGQAAVQAAQDAVAQNGVSAQQAEHQAQAQVASAQDSLAAAGGQLAALRATEALVLTKDAQAVAAARRGLHALAAQGALALFKDRQALDVARSLLDQARSKTDQGARQGHGQVTLAVVVLGNARGALTALGQGAPAAVISQDEARIRGAQAQLDASLATLAQAVLRAPSSGTVTSVFVAAGSPVDASTPVAAIADLTHLAVTLDLSEFDAARVRPGQRALISVDALGGKRFAGKVLYEALSGVDNGGVVSFPVRIAFAGAPGVRLGMNVSVRIIVAERRGVVRVPLEAVSRGQGVATVSVLDAAGQSALRHVVLGLGDNKNVEVKGGLRPGERVVLPGSGAA